jgi:hypothetical protein
MLNSIGVTNTHTNPYAALENPSPSDKINTQQTTDNLSNHARSAVIPQSSGDRAPLNAIMAMESAASKGALNPAVAGMLNNFSLTDSASVSDSSCSIGTSGTGVGAALDLGSFGILSGTGAAGGFELTNPATATGGELSSAVNFAARAINPGIFPLQQQH